MILPIQKVGTCRFCEELHQPGIKYEFGLEIMASPLLSFFFFVQEKAVEKCFSDLSSVETLFKGQSLDTAVRN